MRFTVMGLFSVIHMIRMTLMTHVTRESSVTLLLITVNVC